MKLDSNELAAVHAAATRTEIPHSQLRLSEAYQARGLEDRKPVSYTHLTLPTTPYV